MPARVHALIVVRPDGRTPAAHHLRRTVAALDGQTRPVDDLTIVICGSDPMVVEAARESGAGRVIEAPARTGYAAALALCGKLADADAVWLLAQDTAAEPEALARLVGALELSPSVAFVAPKLVRAHERDAIVSLGVSMTGMGRTVGLADGELDQGQHDTVDDALGSDVRGILVRVSAWRSLGGLDPALRGADEGLDLGVRARLSGARVALAPGAVVAVSGDGVAGLPEPVTAARRRHNDFVRRLAQLHRRFVYARVWAAPLLWLATVPLAVWRAAVDLVRKRPGRILPEIGASVTAMVRLGAIVRARRRLARPRSVPWAQLAPLRITQSELRERLDGEPDAADRRGDLRFFSGGGAWLVLGALVASAAAFTALLAWPVLGGGGLLPLRSGLAQLWSDGAYGLRALGLDTIGPADPFAVVIAVVGTLWPSEPSRALVLLWVAALPLAALGGWFAATRVTESSGLRLAGGILWALAPTFVVALAQGRPAAVLAHLLLPWLFYAGAVAHRGWAGAGAASLLLVGVVASSPSLAPALVVVWIAAIVIALVVGAGRSVTRLVWVLVPALVFAAPFVWRAIRERDGWWLLADPGATWAGPQVAADAAGRALLAAGIPTPDLAGWATVLPGAPLWWVPLLAAPLAILALASPLTQRWAAGTLLLGVCGLGLATAFAAVGISVAFTQSESVPLWPGTALSLAWLGALGAALVGLDAGIAPRARALRGIAAGVLVGAVFVLALPSLTAHGRGTALLTSGPESTLPAYVAARGADDPDVGTIVLTPQNDGGVSARIIWGGSETLGSQSTIVSTRTEPDAQDEAVAALAAGLMTGAADDVVAQLVDEGISFVLLATPSGAESDAARAMRITAESAINQRDGLGAVGTTGKGELWRVVAAVEPRQPAPASVVSISAAIGISQLAVVAIALLLALPTAASRRDARRHPRVVGPSWQEGR
jgi:GT2 family glycosyltransferase